MYKRQEKDGGALPANSFSQILVLDDGIVSTLTLNTVDGTVAGSYVAYISFAEDQVLSSEPGQISIEGIKSFPTAARGVVNNEVIVTCVASGDSYASDVVWYKDDEDITTLGLGSLSSPGRFNLKKIPSSYGDLG